MKSTTLNPFDATNIYCGANNITSFRICELHMETENRQEKVNSNLGLFTQQGHLREAQLHQFFTSSLQS
jgi:hypothetical protein